MSEIIVIVPGLPMDYKVMDNVVLISTELADRMIEEE